MSVATGSRAPVAPIFSFPYLLNPGRTLAWLREHDPMHELPGTDLLVLSRYDDCLAALNHPDLSAAGGQQERREVSGSPTSMLNSDGAEHARLRRPGAALLGPAAVRRAEPIISAGIADLLDGLGPQADLTPQIARPIATLALAAVLGIADLERFAQCAADVEPVLDPRPTPAAAATGQEAVARLHDFVGPLVDAAAPGTPLHTLARSAEITRTDALGIISLATIGGWGPLAELTTVAIHQLLNQPNWGAVAVDPTWRTGFAEDVTRWHTPIPFAARRALLDVELPSGTIPAGRQVLIHLGSADADPQHFADPDLIRSDRERPRDHVAYGSGAHFCLGAALIRGVLPIVLEQFAVRFPAARLRGSALVWQPVAFPRRPFSAVVELAP